MTTLILSDLHLGPGRDPRTGLYSPAEDFFADDAFATLLNHYNGDSQTPDPLPADAPPVTTLVLAGDIFNLWEMSPLDELHQAATGHPVFFNALRRWLKSGNNLFIIPGNHDFQLAFPNIQDALENLLKTQNSKLRFGHFYHNPQARLYIEHGDRYTDPRKPGQPPNSYRRDYYFTSALKSRLPVASVYHAHYVSQVLATDPLAMAPAWRNLRGYLFDPAFQLPAASGDNVTLHTINVNIITANWKRAQSQARLMHALIATSILLKLASSALPGAALATYLLSGNIPGTLYFGRTGLSALALLAAAAITRTLGTAATHTATDLGLIDLPRAAAEDIAPAVERGGVQTLMFGHSHVPDRARFGRVDYINTGTWINVIAPLSAVTPPTRTYAHVDDKGMARLLQWTNDGPVEPIIFRR
jgi:UDP-2,3-diacylglucosamine pyrophosphatase LpxH